GRATALRLAQAGAHVAILARGEAALAAVRAELGAAARDPEQRFAAMPCAGADAPQVDDAVAAAIAALGGLDLLVNNAGIAIAKRFSDTSLAEVRRGFDVDVLGA